MSSGKTYLLQGKEALDDLEDNREFADADYFMAVNATRFARKLLKRILRRSLRSGEGHVDVRGARFSLWRLARLREPTVLNRVLARLDDLAPIATVVAAYLRPFIKRKMVTDGLTRFLGSRNARSEYLTTWLFAAMLEHPGVLPDPWARQAAARVKDRNHPPYLRAVAAVVMARGGTPSDIAWMKGDIENEHHPTVLRGYAVALHWRGELTTTLQRRLIAKAPELAQTVAYLKGRTVLPSLVYRDARLRVK